MTHPLKPDSESIRLQKSQGYNVGMRLYLVRHAQTAWNAERKYQGHTDIPLDEQGLEQARLFAESFDEPVSRILSSDLLRARMTAEALATRAGLEVEVWKSLRERTIGEWEALPIERVAENFVELEGLTGLPREQSRPPEGESMVDVWERMEAVAKELEAYHKPQVVIVHGGSGALLLARLIAGTVYTARSIRFDNTGVTTLARRADGGLQLLKYNDTSHLRAAG